MKLIVKTLKGSHFEIMVQSADTIIAVKKNIEDVQGKDNYPCGQQLLIYNGKVLKDETTLADNKVREDGFLVVMLSKPVSTPAPTSSISNTPEVPSQLYAASDVCGQAAPNVISTSSIEQTIQHIMDIGGDSWDKETVTRALQAAYNNPERAIDYLYSGIPDTAEVAVPVTQPSANEAPSRNNFTATAATFGGPNASPLNLFPQELPSGAAGGNLDPWTFLEITSSFKHYVLWYNQIRIFCRDLFDQPYQDMPHAISVTPEEQEAIDRLEAMGFDRTLVIEAFLACDRNEELAANFLLENAGDYED